MDGEDVDSGLESMAAGGSKEDTPEKNAVSKELEEDDIYEENETLLERLAGLTEMFPERLRNITYSATVLSVKGVKNLYKFACASSWIFFSSSVILFAPVVFELERIQMDEAQRMQSRQMLLGPNTAISGSSGLVPGMPLPVKR